MIALVYFSIIYFAIAQQVAGSDITAGRARALATVAVGLVSAVIGALAWLRSRGSLGNGNGRIMALVAMVLGLIGVVASVMHLAGSTGFGTGGGRLGAIVTLVLGVIGTILGGLTSFPARRAGK